METKFLTQDELNQLKQIQEKRYQLIEKFGIIELKLQEFQIQKNSLIEELKILQQSETKIGLELQQKYGNGTISIDKGEITIQ